MEKRVLLTRLEDAQNWARKNAIWPLGLRARVLRHRDDHRGRLPPQRPVALRRRGHPLLAAPGGHADPLRARLDQDGADHPPHLRPDARAEVGDLDGRLRLERRDVQQLRARGGRRQVPARGRVRAGLPAAPRGPDVRDPEAAGQDHEGAGAGLARALPSRGHGGVRRGAWKCSRSRRASLPDATGLELVAQRVREAVADDAVVGTRFEHGQATTRRGPAAGARRAALPARRGRGALRLPGEPPRLRLPPRGAAPGHPLPAAEHGAPRPAERPDARDGRGSRTCPP